jgi:hypothetical protein
VKAALILAALAGCGGGGGGGADADVSDARVAAFDGACPLEDRVGLFQVLHQPTVSVVTGSVRDGVIPAEVLQLEHEEGGCRYLRKVFPFCDPPCQPAQTCDTDGSCITAPTQQDVGTVTVTGLVDAVAMEPNQFNDYEQADLSSPPFTAGAAILLSAEGGDGGAFQLDGLGVPALVVPDTEWTMQRDTPMTIEWDAAAGVQRIYVSLNVDLHGNSPVTMYCDFEDTGTATIPADMVNRLIDFGITVGFASATIARGTLDRASTGDGCVELQTLSEVDPSFALAP